MAKNYHKLKELTDSYMRGIITEEETKDSFFEIYNQSKFSGKERRCAKKFAKLIDISEISLLTKL